jgi:hypothetical protein
VKDFDAKMRRGGDTALKEAEKFFMGTDAVYQSLRAIAAKLQELGIPYAVAGGMALVAHGYARTTVDVDILVTTEGLAKVHGQLDGLGYIPPFKNSKNLRDTQTGIRIEFLVTGQFPGDGKPKPVAFPDPESAGAFIDGIRYLKLEKLIELKLASGMTNPGRVKDLGDVQELIRALKLDDNFASKLDPYVQDRFVELQRGLQSDQSE